MDAPLFTTLTYKPPKDYNEPLQSGSVVLVPLGKQKVTGYVLGHAEKTSESLPYTLKSISEVLSCKPLFPCSLVPFYRWIAKYYHYPLGEVIRTALPLSPGARSGRRIVLTELGQSRGFAGIADPDGKNQPFFAQLKAEKGLSPAMTRRLWRDKEARAFVQKLAKEGLVQIETELVYAETKAKLESYVMVAGPLAACHVPSEETARAEFLHAYSQEAGLDLKKADIKLLDLFFSLQLKEKGGVTRSSLRQHYAAFAVPLKRLIDKGLLDVEERQVFRDPFAAYPVMQNRDDHTLTKEQEQVIAAVQKAISQHVFTPFLLFGVTGSGKTEVYLRAVEAALHKNRTALVLVPEIALASQLETDFRCRFGDALAVVHSGLREGERFDQWQHVLTRKARVVLGARSAVFVPLTDIGIIIVDEEHESAYKQEDGLPYHGRDLAVVRARQENCPIILGSATPTVNSFHNAKSGKYQLLSLPERISGRALPAVHIVDMKNKKEVSPESWLLSERLLVAIQKNLAEKQQSLLFVNRRGFATFMQCQDCGHVLECQHCRISLTLHQKKGKLLCHYCGFSQHPNSLCPACGSPRVMGRGSGSERIEDEVSALFPKAAIARVDSDTTADRRQHLALFQAVRNREIDILVGTQMIAKGLHFPHVTLVGVVWADSALNLPDYRSGERTFSMLTQVTGRAGRGDMSGQVIIQTNQPSHYAIQMAQSHDYYSLYREEITLRKAMGYPPFSRLINLRLTGLEEREVERAATKVAEFLRHLKGTHQVEIMGPAPAPLAKIKDRYRWQLLLKSQNVAVLHGLCDGLLGEKGKLCPQGVSLFVDVDPESMM